MRKDTRERRIQQIVGGLISSQPISTEAICALWKVNRATAESLIEEAQERLAQHSLINISAERGRAIRQLEEIYRLAIERRSLRDAINARAELTRLLELTNTTPITNTTDEGEIERTRKALESLDLPDTEPNLPLDELSRRVVMYIVTAKKKGEL